MTAEQIASLQSMLATETHPTTLATINRCIENLIMMDPTDDLRECTRCDWTGPLTATVHPKHVPAQILCPACNDTTEPK